MKDSSSAPRARSCLRVGCFGVVGIMLVVGLAVIVLLSYAPVPEQTSRPVDIAAARRLALEGGQPLPVRLNSLIVAKGAFPSAMIVAGSGFKMMDMPVPVFQIVYPDQTTIMVDTAQTEAMHRQMFFGSPYSTDAYDQLQQALRRSRLILLTHEHFDHIGGLVNSPYYEEIQPRVRLNQAQYENLGPESGMTADMRAGLAVLDYTGMTQAAPGVVLIDMAGHSPGSQMIYVQMQDGAEYLLVGDVLWSGLSLERKASRPWLMSLLLGEDRVVIGEQARALIDLRQANPDLHLVISHDSANLQQLLQDGWLADALE